MQKNFLLTVTGVVLVLILILEYFNSFQTTNILKCSSVNETVNEVNVSSLVDNSLKYNLNTVTEEELLSIPGIGEIKADLILTVRDEIEFYSSLSQLLDIEGINEGTYNKIIPYLYIGSQ